MRSNMHRVIYAPGAQATHSRYSLAYLVRGNKSVSMKRLQSDRIPSATEDGEVELDVSCEDVRHFSDSLSPYPHYSFKKIIPVVILTLNVQVGVEKEQGSHSRCGLR